MIQSKRFAVMLLSFFAISIMQVEASQADAHKKKRSAEAKTVQTSHAPATRATGKLVDKGGAKATRGNSKKVSRKNNLKGVHKMVVACSENCEAKFADCRNAAGHENPDELITDLTAIDQTAFKACIDAHNDCLKKCVKAGK